MKPPKDMTDNNWIVKYTRDSLLIHGIVYTVGGIVLTVWFLLELLWK